MAKKTNNYKHALLGIALYLFGILLLTSCKDHSQSASLLLQAQDIMEADPQKALLLLDSIPNPQSMEKGLYMEYVVARVQAKFKNKQDITSDTLIFEARKYFDNRQELNKAALAHFYTGVLYREKKMQDKAFESFLKSENYARQINNHLFTARSHHNMGNIHFDWDIMDKAIDHYRSALKYYEHEKNVDVNKLQVTDLIGRSFDVIKEYDSAYFYFDKGLSLAKQAKNKDYEATFNHHLGFVSRDKKEYNKARNYLHTALLQTVNEEEKLRIYLSLSRLYNVQNKLDSVRYYTTRIEERLSEIKDNYVLSSMYGSLYDYNKQAGNINQALHYLELQKEADKRIANETATSPKLFEAEKKYRISLKDQELADMRIRSYLYVLIGILGIALVLLIACLTTKNIKHKHQQEKERDRNTLLESQNQLLAEKLEKLSFLQSIYQNIANEWLGIHKEIQELVVKYRAKEEPGIFLRIRSMVEDLQQKTNHQLIEWAKDHLRKQAGGEKAIELLDDKYLLTVMFCYCKYKTKDMPAILGLVPSKENLEIRKLNIRNRLRKAGVPEDEINRLLFADE